MNMNMNNNNQFWNSSSSSPLFFEGDKKGETVLNSSVPVRMAFLRKVYGILSVQLAMTTLVSGLIMAMPSIQMFFIRKYVRINVKLVSWILTQTYFQIVLNIFDSSWIMIINMLANIAVTFPLIAKRKEYPLNFKLMGVFVSILDLKFQ